MASENDNGPSLIRWWVLLNSADFVHCDTFHGQSYNACELFCWSAMITLQFSVLKQVIIIIKYLQTQLVVHSIGNP